MPALRLCCFSLLLWWCTAVPAQAHTLITVSLELVAEGDDLSLTLAVSPLDIIACLDPQGPSTRGELRQLAHVLGPYLLGHLAVSADGAALRGAYAGYLPDLLQPGAPVSAAEALPSKLSFVLTWQLPAGARRLQVAPTLFAEEGLPGFCQLVLESGAARKRQVAYVELGKPWTFALIGAAPADPPLPPGMAQALVGGQAVAPPTLAERLVGAFGGGLGWVPLLLSVLLAALHPDRRTRVLWSLACFLGSQLVGLICAGLAGLGPHPVLGGWPGALAALALALANLWQRRGGRLGLRLALLLLLGLALGFLLAASGRLPVGGGADPAVLLPLVAGELALGGAAVGCTAWTWGGELHRRYVVVPMSVLGAVLALLWAVERLLPPGMS